ncbi:MAG: DUF4870 domain-containing protein [Chromatiales bacterium]|nr:DUF4870 domain-containing protein [Chromatiales bacterium]
MSNDVMENTAGLTQDSRNLALLNWLGTLFFGFIPGLILFFIKKDDPYVFNQAKEALNWSIAATIASIIASLLMVVFIGFLLFPIIGIMHIVFCIMGAIAASKGSDFRVPVSLRLIK